MTTPEACKFRTWLPVAPGSHGTAKKHSFTVMTYNILCQKLIQRKLFPYANKTCLKRKQRNGKLLPEISHWKPDIACLQEVETEFWHTAMSPHFGRSNYESRFFQSLAKSHGVSISWKKQKFHIIDEVRVSMDISMEVNGEQLNTDNVALITVLGYGPGDEAVDPYADSVDPEYQIGTPKPDDAEEGGVIVSTAHLFWQPHACYERLQQQHAVMAALMELKAKYPNYHIIATGDYNTTPDDAGYDLLTKPRPVKLSEEQLENLLPFSVDDDDQEEGDKETADNGKPPAMSYAGV
ncbi:RNA exonuclease ngl2, partial [Linderina macrospora]